MSFTEPRGIVTPEAVLLEFETAGVGSRMLAIAIDLGLQGLALFLLNLALFTFALGAGDLGWVGVTLVVVLYFLVLFGYPVAMETLWRGRTLGKAAIGLRVVTVEGAPVRFRHAAIRAALSLIDFFLPPGGITAVLTVLFSRRNQRLGDLAAGTLVLRERTAAIAPHAIAFPPPPGYEAYASTIDVGSLTVEQYGVVRSFLLRRTSLSAEARARLAVRVGNAVALRLHHEPPPMVGPELFLACVAAGYQRRHGFDDWQQAAPTSPPGPRPAGGDRAEAPSPDGPDSEPAPPPGPGTDFAPPE